MGHAGPTILLITMGRARLEALVDMLIYAISLKEYVCNCN